jgi:hypothetical protein
MTRLIATISALAMAAGLAFAPQTALAKHDHDRGNSMYAPGHMKRMCPPGHHWVAAHRKRNGTWVRGYCR